MSVKEVVKKISGSKKYRPLYEKTIERVVKDCLKRYPAKEAEKKARNLLHQIWASYFQSRPDFKKLLGKFKTGTENGGDPVSAVFAFVLRLQSSTRERIPILDEFYQKIFALTGQPKSIVDWACGLNPLSWPWMNLPKNCRYLGLDIDKEQNDFLNSFFKIFGKNNFRAKLADIFIDQTPQADVVFLLKLLPLLEQQQKGSSLAILKKQKAQWLVVYFQTKSLGGKHKNMVDFYTKQFQHLIRKGNWKVIKILFSTELVFIINKHGNSATGR